MNSRSIFESLSLKRGRDTGGSPGAIPLKDSFYLQSCQRIKNIGFDKGYMTAEQRDMYRVRIRDGKLYNGFGEIVNGVYLFAFDIDMNLYVAEESQNPEVPNHDFFTAGLPVRGSGFLAFRYGQLIAVSNNSGHYVPTVNQMWQHCIFSTAFSVENNLSMWFMKIGISKISKLTSQLIVLSMY